MKYVLFDVTNYMHDVNDAVYFDRRTALPFGTTTKIVKIANTEQSLIRAMMKQLNASDLDMEFNTPTELPTFDTSFVLARSAKGSVLLLEAISSDDPLFENNTTTSAAWRVVLVNEFCELLGYFQYILDYQEK